MLICCGLLLFGWGAGFTPGDLLDDTPAGADPIPANPNMPPHCTDNVTFYAYNSPAGSHFFGPEAPMRARAAYQEMLMRRCQDPVLTVAHAAYESGMWSDPAHLQTRVQDFMMNRDHWQNTISRLMAMESECNLSIESMSNEYQTLAMQTGNSRNVPPTLFQVTPNRPSFEVLRVSCPNGRVYNFKLNCGFQPVAQEFPRVPRTPPNPNPPPGSPPGTPPSCCAPPCDNCNPPPPCDNCNPPPGCPTGPNGCKDPNDGINNDPGACSLGDCGPRPVSPVPPPPDPVQPQPNVEPPSNPPPPPADPGPSQPPPAQPVPSPDTAPD